MNKLILAFCTLVVLIGLGVALAQPVQPVRPPRPTSRPATTRPAMLGMDQMRQVMVLGRLDLTQEQKDKVTAILDKAVAEINDKVLTADQKAKAAEAATRPPRGGGMGGPGGAGGPGGGRGGRGGAGGGPGGPAPAGPAPVGPGGI